MANRFYRNQQFSLDPYIVQVNGVATIGASGAPTLQKWSQTTGGGGALAAAPSGGTRGIKSITRNSAGNYTVVLQDSFQRILNWNINFQAAGSGTAASPLVNLATTSTAPNSSSSPQITFQCCSSTGSAADPASGETMYFSFELVNSTAP